MNPVRSLILAAAGNDAVRRVVATAPVSRDVVRRFVAGETAADAVDAAGRLIGDGLRVTLDHLPEGPADRPAAERAVRTHLALLDQLHDVGLTPDTQVSVRPSTIGLAVDETLALDNASRICAAAEQAGTTAVLDVEDHAATDATLRLLAELRRHWPEVGVVLQARLRRTLDDCRALGDTRVLLHEGAAPPPADRHEADLDYVRCANALLAGSGHPVFATHDPRLIEIIGERARWHGRSVEDFEFQLPHGVRTAEQRHLAAEGHVVRVHVPFGRQWHGYLARRLAERPADVAFVLRSLVTRS
ncbi:proline dehydrogenase family protein [Saccharothrix sp. HUAS TT1]|uniref:proline dehydrogenase family protein n=1 Tax=unclassified Saccharothrix TaxID=2593673 RepID=UPI00345C3A73